MAFTRSEISQRYAARHPERVAARHARRWPKYYAANKEKIMARVREWQKNNPDNRRAITKKWYEENRAQAKRTQDRYRKDNPTKYLFALAKRRAVKLGREFSIEQSDLTVPVICPLLLIPINPYSVHQDFRPSIDRIDSTKGYIKGNVQIISHKANRLKSNAVGDELMMLAINVLRAEGKLP